MKRLYLLLIFGVAIACDKLDDNPVYGKVYLTLDLRNRDKALLGIPGYRTYLYSNPGIDYNPQKNERLGLGGLLIVHTPLDEYCVFDLACPNEQTPNRNTIVEVDESMINAVCPRCGTKYQILNGTGIALEGKKYGLRSYHIAVNGYTGIVTN